MATFERRGKFWRVKIRRTGLAAQTRTFDSNTLAQQWARGVETEFDHGVVIDRRLAERTTLAEILSSSPARRSTASSTSSRMQSTRPGPSRRSISLSIPAPSSAGRRRVAPATDGSSAMRSSD